MRGASRAFIHPAPSRPFVEALGENPHEEFAVLDPLRRALAVEARKRMVGVG